MQKKQPLDLKKFIPYRISVLEQQISQSIAQTYTDQFGLSRIEWRVLSTLAMLEKVSAKEICQFTHMDKMQVSRAINGLTQQQLVSQQISQYDQRQSLLTLTEKGLTIYHQIVPLVVEEEKQILKPLTQQEQLQFHQLIHKLCLSLET